MANGHRRLLLANGEAYKADIEKSGGWGQSEPPRTYADARDLVKWELSTALEQCAALPATKRFSDEIVLCLRLHPDVIAKSHDPAGLFSTVRDLDNVGSRSYRTSFDKVAKTKRVQTALAKGESETTGRMVFVRGDDQAFKRLLVALDRGEGDLDDTFKSDIQRIEHFDLLKPEEQLQGFDLWPQWSEGRVELVLHPSWHPQLDQLNFLGNLFRDGPFSTHRTSVTQYSFGPTFVSCYATRAALNELAGANPLRTAHPMKFGGVTDLRASPQYAAPPPPTEKTKSTIKVGIFDGGVDVAHPYLRDHCEQDDGLSSKIPPDPFFLQHGTAVAGAVLYGPLNPYDAKLPLPAPPVSVVSVRVFPTSDPIDVDLYECIDLIEAAVPARPDVKTWNVSFGPRGPITDDAISRFSHALDELAIKHKVNFAIAVGNDGEAGSDQNRVQAPSDMANGLGIGAWTTRNGESVHAPYSCRGLGRESAKLKPDVSAFGGCEHAPFHLVSASSGYKSLASGTSFASPPVAGLCGRILGSFDRSSSLLARALVIHTARHPFKNHDSLLGHGFVRIFDDIVRCEEGEVTVLFQGDLAASKYITLPVMLPANIVKDGKVTVTWTIAGLAPVNANHPFDYTVMCVEDTFYPNSQVFRFTPPPDSVEKPRVLDLQGDALEVATILAAGWRQSDMPVSESGNDYDSKHETDLRRLKYKWEPIVRRTLTKRAENFHNPSLILHAIPRHKALGRIDYAAIVTISAPGFTGDLYDSVLTRYTALQPIRLRAENELRVQI